MEGVPIQFCTSRETLLCPPHSSVTRSVLRRLRAAYTAAAAAAGPPPTITKSYIQVNSEQQTVNRRIPQDFLFSVHYSLFATSVVRTTEVLPTRHCRRRSLFELVLSVCVWRRVQPSPRHSLPFPRVRVLARREWLQEARPDLSWARTAGCYQREMLVLHPRGNPWL